MGWTKSEWQRIRDGESWGDVWMTRNPEYILESAEKMVEKGFENELEQIDCEIEKLEEKIQNLKKEKEELKTKKALLKRAFKEE